MSKPKSKKRQGSKQWWRSSKNRNKVWFPLFAVLAVVAIGGSIWLAVQGGQGGAKPITPGQSVEAFTLPDIVSGRNVSMADYLGKQPVVVVGYMGFF